MFTMLIQGPANRTSLGGVENYLKYGKVVLSHWSNDDPQLLKGLPPEVKVVSTEQDIRGCFNNINICYQVVTTLRGLEVVDTPYVVKVRSDEVYTNMQPMLDKILAHPDKITTSNLFFRPHWFLPFHPSDHIMGGRTETMRNGFDLALKQLKNWSTLVDDEARTLPENPEIILCVNMLRAMGKRVILREAVSLMRDSFEIVPFKQMGPCVWRCGGYTFSEKNDVDSSVDRIEDYT